MGELNYKEIAFNNRNNRNLADFQNSQGDISSYKETFNELMDDLQVFIVREHKDLINEILAGQKEKEVLENIIKEFISKSNKALGFTASSVIKEIVDAMVGWERLQPLIDDENVTDIFTNEDLQVIKRASGEDTITNISFESDEELEQYIKNIGIRTGEKINRDICTMDSFDRINNVRIQAGIYGSPSRKSEVVRKPYFCLRMFRAKDYKAKDFIKNETFNEDILKFYNDVIEDATIMIVGEPEAGKSTHLDFLQGLKNPIRRVIRIEEEEESNFKSKNSVSFIERKVSGEETRKKYDMAEFAKIATRLAGKDVVIGEVRSKEAWYLFRLIDMGYKAIYTIHGSSCRGGIEQTAFLMSLENPNMTYTQLMSKICSSVDFVIYVSQRKVIDIAEVKGYDVQNEEPILNYIFRLNIDEDEKFYWKEGEISKDFRSKLELRKKLKERRV